MLLLIYIYIYTQFGKESQKEIIVPFVNWVFSTKFPLSHFEDKTHFKLTKYWIFSRWHDIFFHYLSENPRPSLFQQAPGFFINSLLYSLEILWYSIKRIFIWIIHSFIWTEQRKQRYQSVGMLITSYHFYMINLF